MEPSATSPARGAARSLVLARYGLAKPPDGCLVIGSSSQVAPVSHIPLDLALAGVPVVEVNMADTPLSQHAVSLRGLAIDILPRLVDLLTSTTMRDQRVRTEN